jgi:hypothetical protein
MPSIHLRKDPDGTTGTMNKRKRMLEDLTAIREQVSE